MVTFMHNRTLKVKPDESRRKKTIISLQQFFLKRGGSSNKEITAAKNKIPMIAHIGHYSSTSF